MPSAVIKLKVKIAWWVRPALAIVLLLDRFQPLRTEDRVSWIADRGITQRDMFE